MEPLETTEQQYEVKGNAVIAAAHDQFLLLSRRTDEAIQLLDAIKQPFGRGRAHHSDMVSASQCIYVKKESHNTFTCCAASIQVLTGSFLLLPTRNIPPSPLSLAASLTAQLESDSSK